MNAAQLCNQDSGNVEWYTPGWVTAAARQVMGTIDLDPASSAVANRAVGAQHIYTAQDDGLALAWFGNVWMNHPFGKGNNRAWIGKLVAEYQSGRVQQACCITYASTSERWFQPLLDYPICFINGRVNYLQPDGKPGGGVSKGSCVTYFGTNVRRFTQVFGAYGGVMVPAQMMAQDAVLVDAQDAAHGAWLAQMAQAVAL